VWHSGNFRQGAARAPSSLPPEGERRSWEKLCQDLLEERDRLRNELSKSAKACEQYKKLVQKLLPIEYSEELANLTFEKAQATAVRDQSVADLVVKPFPGHLLA